MADAVATTTAVRSSDRTVAVYCGASLPVEVPLVLPATVLALGKAVVDKLRESRELAHITALDVVLWRVSSHDDLDALQAGAGAAARLDPALKLKAWGTLDTFASGDVIWVQLLGGGAGACVGRAASGRGGWLEPVARRADEPGAASVFWTCQYPRCPPAAPCSRVPSACRDRATRLQARPPCRQRRPLPPAAALP